MACLNPGLDDLQERTVATGTRAVADYEQPLGLHRQTRACKKALFYGAFSKPFYGGGEGGILCLGPWGLENGRKINVFRTTAVGCVYRQYVPEPTARLKWIRPDG